MNREQELSYASHFLLGKTLARVSMILMHDDPAKLKEELVNLKSELEKEINRLYYSRGHEQAV